MLKFFKCFLGSLFVASFSARASLMLEPVLGYEFGKTDLVTSASLDKGGSTSGSTLGGRIGYKNLLGLWVAADVRILSGASYSGNSSTYDGKVDRSNLYLDVGFNLPLLLRVWAGYGLVTTEKIKFNNGSDTTLKDGGGIKLGVGLTPLPLISINVEYYKSSFKNYTDSTGADSSTSGNFSSSSDSGVIASISLPLSL